MVSKLLVAATGKRNETNPLSFLTDEVVDSPRGAGTAGAQQLADGRVLHERQQAERTSRNIRRLMVSRQSVCASRWSTHHHARAMISE